MGKKTREREFKRAPQFIKAVDGRSVTGVFSTFGVKDSYTDIVQPGAFTKTIQERGGKVLHLWQHDFWSPPTAVVSELREIERSELPGKILADFPEATGGAEVTRQYLETERGNEILAAIRAGSPLQMSFAYDPIRFEMVEDEESGEFVRHLLEIRLHETSDVLWGANSATAASKLPLIPIESLLGQLDAWLSSLKEVRRNATSDLERINQIALMAYELGATNVKLLSDDEPETDEPTDDPDEDTAADDKAARDKELRDEQRRAGANVPPLTLLGAKLELLTL